MNIFFLDEDTTKCAQYHNFAGAGQLPKFRKVALGVPFVNPHNFGMQP